MKELQVTHFTRRGRFPVVVLLLLLSGAGLIAAADFTVINTDDSGAGSLRQAITDANASPGADTISFNIPGAGVHTIMPASILPTINDPVIIDGYSQPGSSMNALANADNAVLLIEINGAGGGGLAGLNIILGGSGSTIRGLVINRFAGAKGILVQGNNCVIEGNFTGTDPTGTIAFGNLSGDGIQVDTGGGGGGGSGNVIGGVLPGQRNISSGNIFNGILIAGDNNVVQGNFIGVDATGANALPNGTLNGHGVRLAFNGSGNLIGGTNAGARNIISGNATADGGNVDIDSGPCCNVGAGKFHRHRRDRH